MDDHTTQLVQLPVLTELQSKREWLVGIWGGSLCYGLIFWLC